jgi:hypothetical protein
MQGYSEQKSQTQPKKRMWICARMDALPIGGAIEEKSNFQMGNQHTGRSTSNFTLLHL